MSVFKNGDEVVLTKHGGDSSINLELQTIGVVSGDAFINPEGVNRIKVIWKSFIFYDDWYVDEDLLEFANFSLENE